MITRIEVDGFKNLLGFSAEFGLFTCIAGANAVGKSNLFDAIEFLSLLAEHPLEDAAEQIRATSGSAESARNLFWNDGETWADTMSLAVELLVPNLAFDELGEAATPEAVCLRYEIKLRYERGLRLVGERLVMLDGTIADHVRFPRSQEFDKAYGATNGPQSTRRTIYDLEAGTRPGSSQASFDLAKAHKTVLSQYATSDYPTLLAANREMASWRRLNLEPVALRRPDKIGTHQRLSSNGEHLPGQIRRLTHGSWVHDSNQYDEDEVSARLCVRLRPVAKLRRIWVLEDASTGLMTLHARLTNGEEVSARGLSDGTLRYLALAVLELTPRPGVFCIEEPENGLHPRRLSDLVDLLTSVATDARQHFDHDEAVEHERMPLRQVLVNTHSSELVSEVYARSPGDLLMASTPLVTGPTGRRARALRLSPLADTWRCDTNDRGVVLPIVDYVGAAVRAAGAVSAAEDS